MALPKRWHDCGRIVADERMNNHDCDDEVMLRRPQEPRRRQIEYLLDQFTVALGKMHLKFRTPTGDNDDLPPAQRLHAASHDDVETRGE